MLSAITGDFRQLSGVEVVAVETADEAAFRQEAARADGTLVIAPESDSILETRCRWVEEVGGRLLGPSSAAVGWAADKLTLARRWQEHGLPTPPSRLLLPGDAPSSNNWPVVCKPRRGAGAQATFVVRNSTELSAVRQRAESQGQAGELIVQPFVRGTAASVAWLIGPSQRIPMLPAAQHLSGDHQLHYQGGEIPLPPDLAHRAVQWTDRAIACVDGLLGYVGVDLILGDAADGSRDSLIELNPRLTTSYIGLRAMAKTNLAMSWLRIVNGEPAAAPEWKAGAARFEANGRVECECPNSNDQLPNE
jgi:predicted ATP-grasp superfamily ATP-dependent carboligase